MTHPLLEFCADISVDDFIDEQKSPLPKEPTLGELPYGLFRTRSGEFVVFNRGYVTLCSWFDGGPVKTDRGRWVKDIAAHEFFYDDWRSPRGNKATLRKCRRVYGKLLEAIADGRSVLSFHIYETKDIVYRDYKPR